MTPPRDAVITHPPQFDSPRGASRTDQPARGLVPLDESTSAMLRALPRRRSTRDRGWLWLSILAALVLHGFFAWFVWRQMRPDMSPLAAAAPSAGAIEIRFIPRDQPVAAPLPPPPSPLRSSPPPKVAATRPRPVVKPEPPSKDAMTVQLPATKPDDAPPPTLFDKNGQPLLPASAASAPPSAEPDYVQRLPTDGDKVMQHGTPIKYAPTRFDKYWHKTSTVDSALQKAVDATTVKKTFTLPGGVHIHCAVSVAMLAGGCGGDPPPPPSKKDGDERLSMAPSQQFGKDPHPPTPPTLEACIAMYRANKPLEHGCPVDTPNRAVDAEKAEAAAKTAAGKP
ncbi:hypothetical protein [Rhodanobacter sp. BL-MT-08]